MASSTPHGKRAAKKRKRSNAAEVLRGFKEIGPSPELADAIESVYNERHGRLTPKRGGRTKRRRSTRAS